MKAQATHQNPKPTIIIYLFSIILYYYNMKNIKMLRTLSFIFFNYIDKNVNF